MSESSVPSAASVARHLRWFRRSHRGRFVYLQSQLDSPGRRCLDVGNLGGDGSSHRKIRDLLESKGCALFGLDLDATLARKTGYPKQVVATETQLPFAPSVFDFVYLGQVIEHVWSPLSALLEVNRVLKPGGLLVLDTPHVYSLGRLVTWVVRGNDTIGDPDHKIFFTPAVMQNLIEHAGFELVDIATDRKWTIFGVSLPWVPAGRRLGSHLLVSAVKRPSEH